MSQVRKLWSKKNAVVFVWPGEEPLELAYDSIRIVVPPRNVIGRVGVGSIYTHPAAELNGKSVPGTAVIEDVTVLTAEGGYITMLSIDHLCRFLTRDRDDLFNRGFNIAENVDQVQEAMLIGLPLYNESQVKRAREIIAREMSRQKGFRDRGETPTASSSQHLVEWAVNHLRTAGGGQVAMSMDKLSAALEGRPDQSPLAPSPGRQMVHATPAEDIVRAASVYREAAELGLSLNNFEMKALLGGSQDTIAKVEVKIKARKIEIQRETSEAAAATA